MSAEPVDEYPPEAFAPDGTAWWELERHPGRNLEYGAEVKNCAWLAFDRPAGSTFTMRDIRAALGSGVANDDVHLNRQLRSTRRLHAVA